MKMKDEDGKMEDGWLRQQRGEKSDIVVYVGSYVGSQALYAKMDLNRRSVESCHIDDDCLRELNITLALAGAAVDAAAKQRGLKLTRPNVTITFEEENA